MPGRKPGKKIAHGEPVLRWMMDNIFIIRTDPAGNIKPDKEKSTERIDGAVAIIMALYRAIRNGGNSGGSVYDESRVRRLIEKVTVYEDKFTVEFKSGMTVDVN